MTSTQWFSPHARLLAVVSALLVLAACASVPPPTDLMQRAQQQLDAARQARATDYAPVDLGLAKKRFASAQAAMGNKKYALARDMANEALADGRLAETRAELAKARKQIHKQNKENKRLRAQLLSPSTPAKSSPAPASSNAGLPAQIILPQPAPAASTGRPTTTGGQP